jgi:hypothetical protein
LTKKDNQHGDHSQTAPSLSTLNAIWLLKTSNSIRLFFLIYHKSTLIL